ncbi:MAG: histidine kinase [Bacteroidales bacterium]|nr:histidine kinase [Bacteroidales bacterium]
MNLAIKNDKIYRIAILTGILLFQAFQGLFAQSPYFRNVRMPESLKETIINCLYQDPEGPLLIGTNHGLYRYDGRNFTLAANAAEGLKLQVSAIYRDPSQTLWVGTRSGNIYRAMGDSLVKFDPQEGLPQKAITGFVTDKGGNLWFSTYGEGLYYYNGRYLYNLNAEDGLTDDYCYGLIADDYGRIWSGTDNGISVCFVKEKLKKIEKITTDQGLPDNIALKLALGKNGLVWVGMQDGGICSVNSNSMKVYYPDIAKNWKYGPVEDILIFNQTLWLSSNNHGILEIDLAINGAPVSFTRGEKFSFNKVNHLLADNQGNSWITTNSELIFSAGPGFKRISNPDIPAHSNVQSILADRTGNVWFSCENRLCRFSPGETGSNRLKDYHVPVNRKIHIISLYEDSAGFIWAGTFGGGLFRINPSSGRVRMINEKDGLTNGNILSIAGKGNEIWLATLGGAYRCSILGHPDVEDVKLKFENFDQKYGPGNNYIYKVFIDSKGRVWFGTDGKGIAVYEKGVFKGFDEKDGIRSKVVYSISEDASGNIWFTTSNAGVYRFDGKKFKNYTTAEGLSDMQISCLLADREHHVFFAHDRGVDILDIRNGSFIYYGEELGLEAINPNLNVVTISSSKLVWLGTQEGILRIEMPDDKRPQRPEVVLNKVSVFLGAENFMGIHKFTATQNHLSFFFNAIWFSSPELVTYQVKLEGYDLDWINTRENLVTYSSLQPGTYVFKVRASLKGNYANSEILSYKFTIEKPLWRKTWFILLVILVGTALAIAMVRIRELRFKQKEASEREKLLFQLQTLRSQVNPHFLFNSFSTLISVIDENKDLAIDYVQKLSQFFRNILEYRDRDLITLREELKLIETYIYLQRQRYGDHFRIELQIDTEYQSTLIPPMTLQMLVENAIKHNVVSPEKPLTVRIYADQNSLFIRNNLQRKKIVESSTGVGLMIIKNRYNLLGLDEINISETKDEYILQLPLIKP